MATTQTRPTKKPLPDAASQAPAFDLTQYGITVTDIRRNLSPAALYSEAIREDPKCEIADTGAVIAFSGEKTGRSPSDNRVVENPESKDEVWWGSVNVPIDNETYETNREWAHREAGEAVPRQLRKVRRWRFCRRSQRRTSPKTPC